MSSLVTFTVWKIKDKRVMKVDENHKNEFSDHKLRVHSKRNIRYGKNALKKVILVWL